MKLRTLTALAVVGTLSLAACGDDDDDTASDTTSVDGGSATTVGGTPTTAGGAATTAAGGSAPAEAGTIVDLAAGTPDLSTLVAAVEAAGLAETLSGPGPFTVFAPTNEAFEALPEGVLDALLLPENQATLVKILTYHVLPAAVPSSDIAPGDVATVEGQTVAIATDGGVTVNDATVVTADVTASNGVVHVIDAVLLPPDVDPSTLVG